MPFLALGTARVPTRVATPVRTLAVTRGTAVAGATVLTALALSGCSLLSPGLPPATDSTSGAQIDQQNADVFYLSVGQCLNDGDTSGQVSDVPSVDCADEHDSEVYYTFDVDGDDYPGKDEIDTAAEAGCADSFADYVGTAYDVSSLSYTYYSPTQQSWTSADDHQVVCIAYAGDRSKLTGSVKDSGL